MKDCSVKGRTVFGSKSIFAKLNEQLVSEMKEQFRSGQFTHRQLAEKYNVSRGAITAILVGRNWKHVP